MTQVRVTRDELAALTARQEVKTSSGATIPVVEGWKDGALTIFVPGRPTHYKGKGNRWTVSTHTKTWRERTALRLLPHLVCSPKSIEAEWPKRITFTVYTSGRGFDGPDNIRLVCSPVLDALGPRRPRAPGMGLIDDDKNPAHVICYTQVTRAKVTGIAVRIELARVGAR